MNKTTAIIISLAVIAVCATIVLVTKYVGNTRVLQTIWGNTSYRTEDQNGLNGSFGMAAGEGGAGSSTW